MRANRARMKRALIALFVLGAVAIALLALGMRRERRSTLRPVAVTRARAQVTPGGSGAAYFVIDNASGVDDRLISVHAGNARRAELHEIEERDGVVRMAPRPEGFDVQNGAHLRLSPGGKHVMFYGVPKDARELNVTLRFLRGGEVDVRVPVLTEVPPDDSDL